MNYIEGTENEESLFESTIIKAFELAISLNLDSVVIGDIAVGMCGFPKEVYFGCLAKAIKQFGEYQSNDSILEVSFIHRDIEFVSKNDFDVILVHHFLRHSKQLFILNLDFDSRVNF